MPFRIVRACAGAGKTGLIVDKCIQSLNTHDGRATVITLTNSVRDEIVQRIRAGMPSAEHRQSGHHDQLMAVGGVLVSSADAFVHRGLLAIGYTQQDGVLMCDDTRLDDAGAPRLIEADDFGGKRVALAHILMAGLPGVLDAALAAALDNPVGCSDSMLLVDEFQDLDDAMCTVSAALGSQLVRHGGLALAVGDPLQNVFGKATGCAIERLELMVQSAHGVDLLIERWTRCHRCPQRHLDLVNRVFPERKMTTTRDTPGTRPMLLAYETGDPLRAAAAIAAAIEDEVQSRGLALDDVAVLAPTVNGNRLLACIEAELNLRLSELVSPAHPAAVKWFLTGETQGGIDWGQAKDRLAMLSVHADKGRTHRLCVLIDVTEGCLPRSSSDAAVQRSLLYVGMTRSCEAMMLAFGAGAPPGAIRLFDAPQQGDATGCMSRYLRLPFASMDELLTVCSWSVRSHRAPAEVEWPPVEAYGPEPRETPNRIPSTVSQWASAIPSPRYLTDSAAGAPIRFAADLGNARGMDVMRAGSLEMAVGLLAQRRLQAALTGGVTSAPEGWRNGASHCRATDLRAIALERATCTCQIGASDPRDLWNLALVDLAGVEDDHRQAHRPWALEMASDLWSADKLSNPSVLELAQAIDKNAQAAAGHLLAQMGARNVAAARFEVECRARVPGHKALLSGRVDLTTPESVIEIKASTTAAPEGEIPGPSSSWWNQVLLYAGILPRDQLKHVAIVDVTRGTAWWRACARGECVLERATSTILPQAAQ